MKIHFSNPKLFSLFFLPNLILQLTLFACPGVEGGLSVPSRRATRWARGCRSLIIARMPTQSRPHAVWLQRRPRLISPLTPSLPPSPACRPEAPRSSGSDSPRCGAKTISPCPGRAGASRRPCEGGSGVVMDNRPPHRKAPPPPGHPVVSVRRRPEP